MTSPSGSKRPRKTASRQVKRPAEMRPVPPKRSPLQRGVKVEGATYNMKRFLTMQVINFSWRNPVGSVHHEISAFCFYIFTYMNKTYSNKLSMIDDNEDMPPLLSAFDFDDEAMEWNAVDFDDDA